jgi:hypothetical protein
MASAGLAYPSDFAILLAGNDGLPDVQIENIPHF